MRTLVLLAAAASCLVAVAPAIALAADPGDASATPLRAYIPTTISPEAAAIYKGYRAFILMKRPPAPKTAAEFEAAYPIIEKHNIEASEARLKLFHPTIIERAINGVTVYEVRPENYKDDGTVIIDVHGGGFVGGSAKSSLGGLAAIAQATGRRFISVEYTVAPRGRWRLVTDQVLAVYKGVIAEGIAANHIGMTGGSAGGDIVAATTLKIRDQGLPMPAALVLISPMTDFTEGGDTRETLKDADPALRADEVRPALDAYADPADQKNPYVSPVYGDFSKGYPPVLIQGGTKEWLLSDMVRLNRRIKEAGGDSDLEIYEGMPHGFPGLMFNAPEGKEATAEQIAFWNRHLPAAKP
jgi:monoterpene epsilon-lactone hydrolase